MANSNLYDEAVAVYPYLIDSLHDDPSIVSLALASESECLVEIQLMLSAPPRCGQQLEPL